MLKIGYCSDTHLDFYAVNNIGKIKRFASSLVPEECRIKDYYDILIIAGDIGHYNDDNIIFLNEFKNWAKEVVCVLGNHDWYLLSSQVKRYGRSSEQRVKVFTRQCDDRGIHLLDPGALTVEKEGKLYTIMGFNGWYDGNYKGLDKVFLNLDWQTNMNDSRLIMPPRMSFDTMFHQDQNRLQEFLQREKQLTSIEVIVSHTMPSLAPEHVQPLYRDDKMTGLYCFDGSILREQYNPTYWIYGHSHNGLSFRIKDTQYLCNTIGYPAERLTAKIKEVTI